MKDLLFRGAATALITPFKDNKVDFDALQRLIDWQIAEGIDGLVICGTTGEKATLNDTEHCEVLKKAVEFAKARVPIIAGTGSNDTAHAVWMTKEANKLGCDGMLVCTPYYNKTTQEGLVEMFKVIADSSDKPVILYNVPSRTGVAIEPETYEVLQNHKKIVGIKEANGDIGKIVKTFSLVGDNLGIYSGNDDQIVPIMSMGGVGVISVLSNLLPKKTSQMCHLALDGKFNEAAKLQMELTPLVNALFSEVNPIPVKAAMAKMGFCEDSLRLPLVPMSDKKREVLYNCMEKQGLI